MIADMLSNKKLNLVVPELFIGGRKLNISLFLLHNLISPTHYFIIKIPNKWQLQNIALNHSSDIDHKDFMNLCKKWTAKPYSF